MLSAAVLGGEAASVFRFTDSDGDQVTVRLRGPGAAAITLTGDVADHADIASIVLSGTTAKSSLQISVRRGGEGDGRTTLGEIVGDGSVKKLRLASTTVNGSGIHLTGSLATFKADALAQGADLIIDVADGKALRIDLLTVAGSDENSSIISTPGGVHTLRIRGNVSHLELFASGDIRTLRIDGNLHDSLLLAGAAYAGEAEGVFAAASIRSVRVAGNVIDSIIAAGGDPGEDGLFENGETLAGGIIRKLQIGGVVAGVHSPHINPGIYAAELGSVKVNGLKLTAKTISAGIGVLGTAVIDPLPSLANALTITDIEAILEQAIARAAQLGVAATIAISDREGNLLAVVRMTGASETVAIDAGGFGGLEAVDGVVKTSLIAATKAGTAALLSSNANAFTTRTAGYIIQKHFPPGIRFQDSGPLFGVQLSNLPTSDVNRLPLGLSADPGGVPLYRNGELIGGIGVEIDGIYTVDRGLVGGKATDEEKVALAGQIGYQPPKKIRADRIFVDGIRLAYANAAPPKLAALGMIESLTALEAGGEVAILLAPRVSPPSKFAITMLGAGPGAIIGEVPDNALLDFFAGGMLAFNDGAALGGLELTAAEVQTILLQAHQLNARLRAQIRGNQPQQSQVTVAVVDTEGNVLGVFRSLDAPMFGYDVAVQKARTAVFFSRADAGDQLRALDDPLAPLVDVAAMQMLFPPGAEQLFDIDDPFTNHVERAAALGVMLDGSVAVADRTGGFLARPNLPDGIPGASPGPFSVAASDQFSPFNTGLQTTLILPKLVEFLLAFNAIADEADAITMFADGLLGGGGVVPLDGVPGLFNSGGLLGNSLANGMQIFAGSVPLYRDGVLIGAVGVSGDGIEQDDYVAFAGAQGFQDFGDVKRADQIVLPGGIRLPYVKLPRAPFAGL